MQRSKRLQSILHSRPCRMREGSVHGFAQHALDVVGHPAMTVSCTSRYGMEAMCVIASAISVCGRQIEGEPVLLLSSNVIERDMRQFFRIDLQINVRNTVALILKRPGRLVSAALRDQPRLVIDEEQPIRKACRRLLPYALKETANSFCREDGAERRFHFPAAVRQ